MQRCSRSNDFVALSFGAGSNAPERQVTLVHSRQCGACQDFKPIWNRVKQEFPNITFRTMTVRQAQEQLRIRVQGVPLVIYRVRGKLRNVHTGKMTDDEFRGFLLRKPK